MQVNYEALDEIIHEKDRVNVDGELNIVSDGCLDIVEYDNVIVDEDFEFEGGEYDYEDADENGEFDGGEYDDETDFGDASGHKSWNTDTNNDGTDGEGLKWSLDNLNESIFPYQILDESLIVDNVNNIVKMDTFNLQNDDVSML
ncbi:unnamed protein product [Lathyrus oleraceus]